MYIVRDTDIHEKLGSLKNGKHNNFVAITNVFLLAVSSLMFDCVSEVVCGECQRLERDKGKLF